MITPITNAAELSEISGGRRRRTVKRSSRTGNTVSNSQSSASGDEIETSATATTSNDPADLGKFSSILSRFGY